MVWDSCNIIFNRNGHIFYTGDLVTGTVVLEFKRKKHVEYIDFKIIGISKASWSRASPTLPYIKLYSQKSKIFDVTIDIFRDINGIKVNPGMCTYPFDFILPPHAPSSFKSSVATVKYFIQITSKTSCNMSRTKIFPMCVLSKINVNHFEEYKVPTLFELSKTLWSTGSISVFFKTYRGFTFEQRLPFEVIISNEKRVIISKIRVTLIQKRNYTVTSGHYDDEKAVCKVIHTEFTNERNETCKLFMDVPWISPTSLNVTDAMINISYVLRVEICFLFHLTLHKDIPVIISTIPVLHYPFAT
ncbi:arrestin domain-containing protein 3-like [Epargyreus clarus]|uniref:arrestin domain-containing protein 3-like n=1 Tax=Epargyreus clarus TaxID=520877 RepID=UPI003C2EE0B8